MCAQVYSDPFLDITSDISQLSVLDNGNTFSSSSEDSYSFLEILPPSYEDLWLQTVEIVQSIKQQGRLLDFIVEFQKLIETTDPVIATLFIQPRTSLQPDIFSTDPVVDSTLQTELFPELFLYPLPLSTQPLQSSNTTSSDQQQTGELSVDEVIDNSRKRTLGTDASNSQPPKRVAASDSDGTPVSVSLSIEAETITTAAREDGEHQSKPARVVKAPGKKRKGRDTRGVPPSTGSNEMEEIQTDHQSKPKGMILYNLSLLFKTNIDWFCVMTNTAPSKCLSDKVLAAVQDAHDRIRNQVQNTEFLEISPVTRDTELSSLESALNKCEQNAGKVNSQLIYVRFCLGRHIKKISDEVQNLQLSPQTAQTEISNRYYAQARVAKTAGHIRRSFAIYTLFRNLDDNVISAIRNVPIYQMYDISSEEAEHICGLISELKLD
jgi:hypothetical protein